jgi:hypothetical protein
VIVCPQHRLSRIADIGRLGERKRTRSNRQSCIRPDQEIEALQQKLRPSLEQEFEFVLVRNADFSDIIERRAKVARKIPHQNFPNAMGVDGLTVVEGHSGAEKDLMR